MGTYYDDKSGFISKLDTFESVKEWKCRPVFRRKILKPLWINRNKERNW